MERIDVLIPTYNNLEQLMQCVNSIQLTDGYWPVRIIIVNNGKIPVDEYIQGTFPENKNIIVINEKENLGWEGGLKRGLKESKSKYVVFANDDIFIPISSCLWLRKMVTLMEHNEIIGAIGPSSNVVMGNQNIWSNLNAPFFAVPFLIGFCMLIRRKALDECGGVDDSLSGGDDLDLSLRLQKTGYSCVVRKDVFVYHHGFQTGIQLYGDHTKPNGWNSSEMTEKTDHGLIKKHGFLDWWKLRTERVDLQKSFIDNKNKDTEGEAVKHFIPKTAKTIIELGVGGKKTVKNSIGIDRIEKGKMIPYIDQPSVADIVSDVTEPLPLDEKSADVIIARHILEHCLDTIETLRNWAKILKTGGRLILAIPDEKNIESVPLNPEHLHAFSIESLKNIGKCVGLKYIGKKEKYSNVSFVISFEKIK